MNKSIKKIIKPVVNAGLSTMELLTGFKTDPTGYEPPRWKMLIGSYESFLIASILEKLPQTGVFIDVGANVGYISKQVAKARPSAKSIFSVEPNPRLKTILTYNLGKYNNCEILNFGLSSKDGNLEFYEGYESALGSFVKGYNEAFMSHQEYQVKATKVPVKRGDELFKNVGIIDVMKVDVEGFELEVLNGFCVLLEKGTIKNIFFEVQTLSQSLAGSSALNLIRLLKRYHYDVIGVEEHWKGISIDEQNIEKLAAELGEKGYTTLLATNNKAIVNGPR